MIDLTQEERIGREAANLRTHWSSSPRWDGIERAYTAEDVIRLRGSITVEHTLARLGAERLWCLLTTREHVPALGALTGGQAVEMVKAGLKAIYLSGWQVAADANLSGQTYPDQSLYPANSVPAVVKRINSALAWGLGWGLESERGRPCFWHSGDNGTYHCFALGDPATGDAVVVFTNSNFGPKVYQRLINHATGRDHPAFLWV